MDVLFPTHVLEYLWPYGGTDFSNMRLFEQKHKGTGLPDAPADTERQLLIQDCLVVWQLEEIELAGDFELFFECFGVNADAH